jgi:hypothetical protein
VPDADDVTTTLGMLPRLADVGVPRGRLVA